jgi:hypothetical protein
MQASVRRIQWNDAPVVVDVRFRGEFDRGQVPGAIGTAFFAPETAKLPKDKSTELVIYCGHDQRAWIAKQLPGPAWLSEIPLFSKDMRRAGKRPFCHWNIDGSSATERTK